MNSLARIAAAVFLIIPLCVAQDEKPWQFPSALRPQMEARLQQFTTAQAEGRWDDVAALLGDYRRGYVGYMRYTPDHKNCLVDAMKAFPMVAFDYQINQSSFSSEILSTPPNRRWWTLVGDGDFRSSSGLQKRRTSLIAYRNGDDWFFTPPPFDDVPMRSKLTAEEIALDRKDEVEVRIPDDAPIEVIDLQVHIDPQELKSRTVEFRFHNKTQKKVTAYSFAIDDEKQNGSISVGTGAERDAITPGGDSRVWKESYTAFLYWCEGAAKMRFTLGNVSFEDGSEWQPKETAVSPDRK